MKKSRLVFFISICVALLFLCQLIPAVPKVSEYFDSHPSPVHLQFDINPLHDTMPVLHSSAERQSFIKILAKTPDGNIELSETSQISNLKRPVQELWPDMRDSIKQAVPQYFNGSKYKIDLLS